MSLLAGERPATDGRAGGKRSHQRLAKDGMEGQSSLYPLQFTEPGILRVTNVTLSRRAPCHGWQGRGLAEHLVLAMDGNVCATYRCPHPREGEEEILIAHPI